MRTYIMDLGSDIWRSIIIGYQALANPSIDTVENNIYNNNAKYLNAILCGLLNFKLEKIMHCESTKDI